MPEQYFTRQPTSESNPRDIALSYRGCALDFSTDAGVFSKGEMDAGTRVLLDALPPEIAGRVLDLGCGWGAVGVCVGKRYPGAHLVFSDINERALALARENARRNGVAGDFALSDGLDAIDGAFDFILTNPPIRAGKQVIYRLFAQCAQRLTPGGSLYLVIRKRQGAESAIRYLRGLFDEVIALDKSGGYWVLRCKNMENNEGEKQ